MPFTTSCAAVPCPRKATSADPSRPSRRAGFEGPIGPRRPFLFAFESGGTLDIDADIKIGVDGNTEIVNGIPHNKPLSFKIPKAQSEQGEKFMRLLKAAIDG